MNFSAADHAHMALALHAARRGLYSATPNPRVGCVLVKDEAVLATGWHEKTGGPHAEIVALHAAGAAAQGATAYVTLEPCAHTGRTPPCVNALLRAGVARVVAAMADPNPQVAGRGLEQLRAAGVQVDVGLMAAAARDLNIGFISRMTRQRPWVRLKLALSLDGKTALANGVSQWITSPESRRDAQHFRAQSCAMLTGIGTVLADDPALTVRDVSTPRQPLRVVVDRELKTPPAARVLADGHALIYTAMNATAAPTALRATGADIIERADQAGRVDLPALLHDLAQRGINEVLVEAGARLNGALLDAGCVDELLIYQAPLLLGDSARGAALLPPMTSLAQRIDLDIFETRQIGPDTRIRARVNQHALIPDS